MKLNELRDNPGARHSQKRVGRGLATGLGKTSGRGQKGQGARTGVSLNGFEGGQTPLYRRLPKRGFVNLFRTSYDEVTLGRLQLAVEKGTLDPKVTITEEMLFVSGLVNGKGVGVKLLASGEVKTALNLEISKASQAAVQAIEKAKGSVKLHAE